MQTDNLLGMPKPILWGKKTKCRNLIYFFLQHAIKLIKKSSKKSVILFEKLPVG